MKALKTVTAMAAMMLFAGVAMAYDFAVTNSTGSKITALVASEDGENWGSFNIGNGIAAGATAELVWSPETDDTGCEWVIVATFADGSNSEPNAFDFCADELHLEITE